MMASTVPLVLLGPVGGTVADRHSRRAIVITTDVLRALALGALAAFFMYRRDAATAHIGLLIAVATFNGVMSAAFTPAVHAFIPALVQKDRLAAANSLSHFSSQAAVMVGQALGGVLYLQWGAPGLLLFDALSFGYAAIATGFIPPDRPRKPLQCRDTGQRTAPAHIGLPHRRKIRCGMNGRRTTIGVCSRTSGSSAAE